MEDEQSAMESSRLKWILSEKISEVLLNHCKILNISKGQMDILSIQNITNCVWMNKNSSTKSMMKVYLSWRIMFDMVCEPL